MGETGGIFVIDAETGDISQWTNIDLGTDNVVAAHGDYKNEGDYGFRAYVGNDHTDGHAYAYKSISEGYNDVYVRAYIYIPSSYDMPTWQVHEVLGFNDGSYGNSAAAIAIENYSGTPGPPTYWRFHVIGALADTPRSNTNFSTDQWHYIEVRWVEDGSNGGIEVWVDGDKLCSDLDQDTTSKNVDRAYAGIGVSADPGIGSYLYFDDIKADTSYIGAYSAGEEEGLSIPVAMHHYAQMRN